jgi:DNA-binding NtrC family response regulator
MAGRNKSDKSGCSILLIDDDATFARIFSKELKRLDYRVDHVDGGQKGLEAVSRGLYDVVLLDIFMPEMDGLTVLRSIRERQPEMPVIMLTGGATVDTAIRSMKLGAFDYLTKPFRLEEVRISIEKALENRRLRESNVKLKQGLAERGFSEIVGKSDAIRSVFDMIDKVSQSDSTVLLMGESGTGKELAARAIHRHSRRAEEPFVVVDCGALHENLFESELFGHERGAYTGAVRRKHGLFEVASGGTIFLDEIAEISVPIQAKLLRVIETGELRRLGGVGSMKVDVRIIAATNRDLEKMVGDGTFREDLYYRLNVFSISIPPLRDRKDDIAELVSHFLTKKSRVSDGPGEISDDALGLITEFDWPGNVRELENVIERALIVSDGGKIDVGDLPGALKTNFHFAENAREFKTMSEMEDEYIRFILEKCDGNQSRAAQILGLDPKTIYRRMKKNQA